MKQTLIDNKFGNCLQTCVAKLLNKPLDHVPNFMVYEHHWWSALVMYLGIHGYTPAYVLNEAPPSDGNDYIVSLKFKHHSEGIAHAVIMNGNDVVFDPWPQIDYCYTDSIIQGYYQLIKTR
jgi:hypothetical protein